MKIEADVLGVEQAMDFNTLTTSQFVVLDILGSRLRVPITEDQLEALTRSAAQVQGAMQPETTFDDTRESAGVPPASADLVSEPIPEREHSLENYGGVMAELTEQPVEPEIDAAPGGILDGFFDESEEEKARKLRARKPQRRTVPRDEAGNPVVEQRTLPAVPGFESPVSDDDGFAQG